MFRKRKTKTNKSHQKHVQQIEERCKEAWDTIKKNPGGKFFGISPRPWILVLGSEESGKTSLLSNAELSLISAHQDSTTGKQKNLVDWWIGKEAVFIDPASEIALPNTTTEETQWETLLQTIHSYRLGRPIQQILLVIDLPSLLKPSQKTINQLSEQLKQVQELSTIIPVSIIISKCDSLAGFNDMFDDFNTTQRKQIFGIHFSKKDRKNGLALSLQTSLTALIERLKSRRIHRLHREQSIEKRRQIFRFPNEFISIGKSIENLINQLPFSDEIPLSGVYFTSIHHHRAYFIHDTLKCIIEFAKRPIPITKPYSAERLLALPIAAAIIFAFTLTWHIGYNKTISIINDVQETLAATPNNIPQTTPWLGELNTLGNVLKTIQDKQVIPYQWFGLLPTHKINTIANKKYQRLLDTKFKNYLESTLLSQIQLGMKGDKLALFDALKAYLSLSQSKHYDKNIITSWYRIYWKALYPQKKSLQDQLELHLSMLLKSNKPLINPNKDVIRDARDTLQKLPLSDLAFLELQGEYRSVNTPISEDSNLEGVLLSNATIPEFFTEKNAQEILKHKIPSIGKILNKGNWVLGTTTGKQITTEEQANIAKKLRKLYLEYYTNVWAEKIPTIQFKPADSFDEISQRIDLITNPKSKFIQLLKKVAHNVSLNGESKNKDLNAIKDYLDKKGQYAAINTVLKNLKSTLSRIKKSDHKNKQSYSIAKNRFQGNTNNPISTLFSVASNNPEPISSWLNTIAMSSWKLTLKNTRAYLNTVWKSIVLPVYYDEINNRYPVFKNSSDNISLDHFNDFFGPNGAITAFFIYYLQYFVDTTKNYWTWKTMNGESLRIPQKTLNSFIRASIIQQMFFSDNKNQMGFKFVLTPSNLSGNSKKLTLNVGGQVLNVTQNSNTKKLFNWPGKDSNYVTVQFIRTDGDNPTETYSGPWAWFRMLDANTLQSSPDPAKFTLSIQSGSNSASFTLIANHRINPMVPGVIAKFRLPPKL